MTSLAPWTIELVGPKGYIHGWIFVGVPAVGQEVSHPQHGHGHVTGIQDHAVQVQYDRSGQTHPYTRKGQEQTDPLAAQHRMEAAYHAGHTEVKDLAGGKIADSVKLVRLSDGSHAVVKHAWASEAKNEYLSGLVASAIGIKDAHVVRLDDKTTMAPYIAGETGMARYVKAGEGVKTKKAKAVAGGQELMRHWHAPGAKDIAKLDLLINNSDRNAGNYLFDEHGTVHPIDHGGAKMEFGGRLYADMAHTTPVMTMKSYFAQEHFGRGGAAVEKYMVGKFEMDRPADSVHESEIKVPFTKQELLRDRANLEKVKPQFDQADAAHEYENVMYRLGVLIDKAAAQ